jgi:uncharacterized protein DUF5675
MNLTLKREVYGANGIFGSLFSIDNSILLFTLEHAYDDGGEFVPKIPIGTYECVRGIHQLEPTSINPKPQPFSTFEITGVVGHTNLLFHTGNFNEDSAGCVLVATGRNEHMLTNSREGFERFMDAQTGCDSFELIVI